MVSQLGEIDLATARPPAPAPHGNDQLVIEQDVDLQIVEEWVARTWPSAQALQNEIKELLISALQLDDLRPDDIDAEQALFVEGLGLDSIDALELGVALQKRYGISLSADSEDTRRHFASVRALAALVETQRKQ